MDEGTNINITNIAYVTQGRPKNPSVTVHIFFYVLNSVEAGVGDALEEDHDNHVSPQDSVLYGMLESYFGGIFCRDCPGSLELLPLINFITNIEYLINQAVKV